MIENPLEELSKRLMSYEPTDAELGERYRKEIAMMLHRGRGNVRRWMQVVNGIIFILIGSLGMLIPVVPWMERRPVPPFAHWLMVSGGCYMGIMGVVFLICGIRDIDPRRYRTLWFGMGMLFTSLLAAVLLNESWQSQDATSRWQLTEVAFIMLGLVGVTMIIHFMEDYFKRTDLRLLELEYRLADMAARGRKAERGKGA